MQVYGPNCKLPEKYHALFVIVLPNLWIQETVIVLIQQQIIVLTDSCLISMV